MAKQMTWLDAIDEVLREASSPLHYTVITEQIIAKRLRKDLGATPEMTVNAQITRSIKHNPEGTKYVRIMKGVFALKSQVSESLHVGEIVDPGSEVDAEDVDELNVIVSSFGMFWRRDGVSWSRNPKLLGVQKSTATPVDFCSQFGIYLLYDGREVIYVGRTTDRPLGIRLFEHTQDRLSGRWDRFSWFGMRPVSEEGVLGEAPDKYLSEQLIPALESILIEALEPRQNRKRGDDIGSVEYQQKIDPEIEKRKIKAAIDKALSRE